MARSDVGIDRGMFGRLRLAVVWTTFAVLAMCVGDAASTTADQQPRRALAGSPATLVFVNEDDCDGCGAGGTTYNLYMATVDGRGLRSLGEGYDPAVSPDGRTIAVGRDYDLVLLHPWTSGREDTVLSLKSDVVASPSWAPDGRALAFAAGGAVYVVPAGHPRGKRRITPRQRRPCPAGCAIRQAADPAWSSRGEIAYSRANPAHADLAAIVVMRADGSGKHAVTGGLMADREPDWSPAGDRIAFTRCQLSVATGDCEPKGIFIVSANGGRARRLTTDAESPAWSPDGRTIAFERHGEIYLIPADGGRAHRVPLPRDFIINGLIQPDWRLTP